MGNTHSEKLEKEFRLSDDFVPPKLEEWKSKLEKDLKGKPYEKLISKTYENIDIKPIYTREDLRGLNFTNDFPGTGSFARGNLKTGEWEIRESEAADSEDYRVKPLSYLAETGSIPESVDAVIKNKADRFRSGENSEKLIIDGTVYSNSGANAVQELAFVFSEAVEYFNQFLKYNLSPEDVAPNFEFRLGIGSDFFMEMAKFRAARMVWAGICETAGISPNDNSMFIHAVSSKANKSVFDPHVNMLRSTSEVFAAVSGGADAITTFSFDEPSGGKSELGKRIARNTQIILKEESHLDAVIDPAGGSYYVESLSSKLAESTVELFKEIESRGGFIECLQSGFLQDSVDEIVRKKVKDFHKRKLTMVGVNSFVNPNETLQNSRHENETRTHVNPAIKPFHRFNLSDEFERLRKNISQAGFKVLLLNFGEPGEFKPRADFSRELFEAGGFKVQSSEPISSPDETPELIEKFSPNAVAICSSDARYPELVPAIFKYLKQLSNPVCVILAGRPTEYLNKFKEIGVDEFIFLGCDAYDIINRLNEKFRGNQI